MYRALLCAAWNTDNPPYLPTDDAELAELADAPSAEAWAEHKAAILERFEHTDSGLVHRKSLRLFEEAISLHNQRAKGGQARWEESSKGKRAKGTTEKTKNRRTPLPEGFGISDRVKAWASEKGYSRLHEHFEYFISYVKRSGKLYCDWDEALMTAIRDNWAKLPGERRSSDAPPISASEIARRQQAGEEWR